MTHLAEGTPPAAPRNQAQKNLRGIAFMLLAMAGFMCSDTLLKIARKDLQAGQILLIRGCFALIILLLVMIVTSQLGTMRQIHDRRLLLRGGIEGCIAVLFVIAIGGMALADITAVILMTPLLITLFAVLFLGEKVGWRRWSAILIGFLGVLLVLRPGESAVPLWAGLAALGSALLVPARDILTRQIPARISSLAITITTTLCTTAAGLVHMLATTGWVPPPTPALLAALAAAIFVLIGNYAVIEAHREADLSVVSPFRFSSIVMALGLGIVIFGEWPTGWSLIGATLIAGSGLYSAHRERVRRREVATQATSPSQ
jgi:drug/metabolite transporter (DMT)-like permease